MLEARVRVPEDARIGGGAYHGDLCFLIVNSEPGRRVVVQFTPAQAEALIAKITEAMNEAAAERAREAA